MTDLLFSPELDEETKSKIKLILKDESQYFNFTDVAFKYDMDKMEKFNTFITHNWKLKTFEDSIYNYLHDFSEDVYVMYGRFFFMVAYKKAPNFDPEERDKAIEERLKIDNTYRIKNPKRKYFKLRVY